ncbi:MAG: IS200/IS605 family accessory protein TnpB-related protein [Infirmifilum sp.]
MPLPGLATREGGHVLVGTLKLKMTVPPKDLGEVVRRYAEAKRFVLGWLYEHKTTKPADAHHYKTLAEELQGKYPRRWRENERILRRIRHFHKRARNILLDSARKTGKSVAEEAEKLGANAVVLEDLNKMMKQVKKLRKEHRDRLYLMQYNRIQWWIAWQAAKHGLQVVYVDPRGTSSTCPYDGAKMVEVGHRTPSVAPGVAKRTTAT